MIYGRSPLGDEIPEGLGSKAGRLADLSPTWTADPRRHLGNPDIVIMWRNVRKLRRQLGFDHENPGPLRP